MELEEYIALHTSAEPSELRRIERESNLRMVHGRMCSGHIQGRLLKMLVQMIRPRRVLELGTFTAYSALCIAEGLAEAWPEGKGPEESPRLLTVEANDEFEDFIRENLARSPFGSYVDLHIGEALGLMRSLPDRSFDLIFIDADKRSYSRFYEEAMRLLDEGGYILADNTLWDGRVADGKHHDPQTLGIIEFNRLVASDPRSEQVILNIRDGLTLIRKRRE